MINAAMAGLGWWGRTIIDSVQGKTGRVRFTRAVTKEPDEARDFAAAHGLALSTDLAEVLADESIDAVHLATPHSLHAEHIAAVAAAGKSGRQDHRRLRRPASGPERGRYRLDLV